MFLRKRPRLLVVGLAVAALALPAISREAQAAPAPPKARITPKQAEAAAVRKLGGKASPAKYEFEDGHWQYAVLVTTARGMYEADVSATTGKVTATEKTTPAEEAREEAADRRAADRKAAAQRAKKRANRKTEKGEKD